MYYAANAPRLRWGSWLARPLLFSAGMSRTETSLLFSLNELRSLETERAAKERAEIVAEQQRRADELARRRADEAEHQRPDDALGAALCERDAQLALAQRAVERHAAMAAELGDARAQLAAAARALATPEGAASSPPRDRGWTVVNGLLAVGCLSLLTTTIVFYGKAPRIIERAVPVLTPVVIATPAGATPAAVLETPKPRPTPVPIRKSTPKATSTSVTCRPEDDILCGMDLSK